MHPPMMLSADRNVCPFGSLTCISHSGSEDQEHLQTAAPRRPFVPVMLNDGPQVSMPTSHVTYVPLIHCHYLNHRLSQPAPRHPPPLTSPCVWPRPTDTHSSSQDVEIATLTISNVGNSKKLLLIAALQ